MSLQTTKRKARIINPRQLGKDYFSLTPINGVTKEFFYRGGFTKVYNEQQEKIADEKLLRQKNRDDAEISRFTKEKLVPYYNYARWGFFFSILAVIISVIGLFIGKS
jgi:hypothetical protein